MATQLLLSELAAAFAHPGENRGFTRFDRQECRTRQGVLVPIKKTWVAKYFGNQLFWIGVIDVAESSQRVLSCCHTETTRCPAGAGPFPAAGRLRMYVTFMSGPSGCTCNSPNENSVTCALFQSSSQPARSNMRPSAFTPTNVGDRLRSTLTQSLPWMDCHIRRSYCSAPVAFFHVGCLGSPAQPASEASTINTSMERIKKFNHRGHRGTQRNS